MGIQASKQVARKLPTQPRPETLQNIPKASPATVQPDISQHIQEPLFDKQEEEEKANPLHLANLSKLGPVTVPPVVTKMRKSDRMLGIIEERKKLDQEELEDPNAKHRVTIDKLYSLLEHRKHESPAPLDWAAMSRDTTIDEDKLKALFKHYNTVTVMPAADPNDPTERRLGVWVENKEQWKQAIQDTHKRHALERQQQIEKDHKPTDTETNESQRDKQLKDLFSD
ncbi:hypothetical protein BC940DRAFT_267060 [Gongronella butleri]|nr:hypothetical protein BC940DRAFT_267060 [Gongronella butleri]